jgi:hypothetical protein
MSTPTHLPPGTRRHAQGVRLAALLNEVAQAEQLDPADRARLVRASNALAECERDRLVTGARR